MKFYRPPIYLYFPLFVFLLYFLADKICSLDAYKYLAMDDAPFLIFEYKEELLEKLERFSRKNVSMETATGNTLFPAGDPIPAKNKKTYKVAEESYSPSRKAKKIMLVLGTSRLLFLNHAYVVRNYPDWELFNFSGPVTYPAYYLYILEKALRKGARPRLLVVEAAPFQYSDGTDAFARSNLAYSFDLRFVLEHFGELKRDEVSYFLARYLFSAYRYPPKWKNILARLMHPETDKTLQAFKMIDAFQRSHNGSSRNIIPKDDWFQSDYATLQYQAEHKTIPWLYRNYRLSERQFSFTKELLELAKRYKIKVFLINPAVSGPLRDALKKRKDIQESLAQFERRMDRLAKHYGALRIDYNRHPDYKCNTFVDDAHMAIACYNLMVDDLMRQWWLSKAGGAF